VSALAARANNFDAVRLIAAISVVFSHAFLIAEGSEQNEPLARLSDNQSILGLLAVFVFFTISGFLVTQSFLSTKSLLRFAVKRAARIFPGLVASVLVCGLVLGPLVTVLPLRDYLGDPRVLEFLGKSVALELGDPHLPGVTFSPLGIGETLNGSLWTLRYEVMMYGMVLALGWLRLLRLSTSVVLLGLGMLAIQFEHEVEVLGDAGNWAWMLSFFAAGMCLYFLRDSGILRWEAAALAGLGLVASTWAHHLILLFGLFGGFLTIYVALKHTPALDCLSRFGDLSYGVYIYGWPASQWAIHANGGAATWWQVFLEGTAVSLGLAWLSWHGIEKRCLRAVRQGTAKPAVA
jgi:peptidoglycan/LPS O-acetylase OafA/YrhL